jgi:hypothetical protein
MRTTANTVNKGVFLLYNVLRSLHITSIIRCNYIKILCPNLLYSLLQTIRKVGARITVFACIYRLDENGFISSNKHVVDYAFTTWIGPAISIKA